MEATSFHAIEFVVILGFGAVLYFYFTYTFFKKWWDRHKKRTGHNPPAMQRLAIAMALVIPALYVFYYMLRYGGG